MALNQQTLKHLQKNKPSYESKFITNSILNFQELDFIIQNINSNCIESITKEGKKPFLNLDKNSKDSLIISNALNTKSIFQNFVNVFKEKYPILKKMLRHDVHIYAGFSKDSFVFPVHVDNSYTIILQTEGNCKWVLPKDFEVDLECGDIIFIPKGTEHGCIPYSERISLSFAFWES